MNTEAILRIITNTISNKLNPGDGYGLMEEEFRAWKEAQETAPEIAKAVIEALQDMRVLNEPVRLETKGGRS